MKFIVYRLTCTTTGKSYIGVAQKSVDARWRQHVSAMLSAIRRGRRCTYLWKAIHKYGADAWIREVLVESMGSTQEMMSAERAAIVEYQTMAPKGYNLTSGGEGTPGHTMSVEGRRRLSESKKGTHATMETRLKMSATRKGRTVPAQTRQRLSDAQRGSKNHRYGLTWDETHKAKMRARFIGEGNPFYGKSHTSQSRAKIRAALVNRDTTGARNPSARAVCIDGQRYATMRAAMADIGVTYPILKKRLHSLEWPTYFFAEIL